MEKGNRHVKKRNRWYRYRDIEVGSVQLTVLFYMNTLLTKIGDFSFWLLIGWKKSVKRIAYRQITQISLRQKHLRVGLCIIVWWNDVDAWNRFWKLKIVWNGTDMDWIRYFRFYSVSASKFLAYTFWAQNSPRANFHLWKIRLILFWTFLFSSFFTHFFSHKIWVSA